jgi:hydrogenase nickel incorporation protein HypA/HybF
MHELGIAREICRVVGEAAAGREVTSVTVQIGVLSAVAAAALEFCIAEVAKDAGLGEPRILLATVAAAFECSCGASYTTEDPLEPCPSCGGYDRRITSGMDVVISQIELEEERTQ